MAQRWGGDREERARRRERCAILGRPPVSVWGGGVTLAHGASRPQGARAGEEGRSRGGRGTTTAMEAPAWAVWEGPPALRA